MNNDLISVIIPVFNVEKYLPDCLYSVSSQSYKNLEIVLIDDGSTDKSLKVCEEYHSQDYRVVVLHKENGGVSSARNMGLEYAHGDYVTFVDPDDLIAPHYIESLYRALIKANAQIAVCRAFDCKEENIDQFVKVYTREKIIYQEISVGSDYDFFAEYAHYTVWGALFQREILKNITFQQDLYVGEDSFFYMQALLSSKYITYTNARLYCYIKRTTSATANDAYNDKKFTEVEAWRRICELTQSLGGKAHGSALASLGIRSANAIKRMLIFGGFDKEKYKYCTNLCRKLLVYVLRYAAPPKSKIGYTIIAMNPKIGVKLYHHRWTK